MKRFACERSASGPSPGKVAALVVCAVVAQVMLAPAARAITATLSANQGPPGTQVTVRITDLRIPCEVRFDDLLVVGEAGCQPSADGTVSPSFSVPAEATAGYHQVSVTARRPGSSSQLSNSFRVTGSRPPAGSSSTPGSSSSPASPSDKASPSLDATPSPGSSSSPSPEASPTAGPASGSPTAGGSGIDAAVSSESGVETDSGIPAAVIALVAVGVGLTVAAAIYVLLTRRGRG